MARMVTLTAMAIGTRWFDFDAVAVAAGAGAGPRAAPFAVGVPSSRAKLVTGANGGFVPSAVPLRGSLAVLASGFGAGCFGRGGATTTGDVRACDGGATELGGGIAGGCALSA